MQVAEVRNLVPRGEVIGRYALRQVTESAGSKFVDREGKAGDPVIDRQTVNSRNLEGTITCWRTILGLSEPKLIDFESESRTLTSALHSSNVQLNSGHFVTSS